MRGWITAVSVAALALMIAGVVGSAGAVSPAPVAHTLTVNGAAQRVVSSGAGQEAFTVAYRTALDDALEDAKAKAARIAAKEGLALGPVSELSETSNSALAGCMFAYGAADSGGRQSAPSAAPPPAKPKRQRKPKPKPTSTARPAQDQSYPCPVQASIMLVYEIA